MYEEQELDRQRALAGWDEQTCAEFEEFLDWWDGEGGQDEDSDDRSGQF